MVNKAKSSPAALPSVERLAGDGALVPFCEAFGRPFVTGAAREIIAAARAQLLAGEDMDMAALANRVGAHIETVMAPSLVPVFNLSGTLFGRGRPGDDADQLDSPAQREDPPAARALGTV